jgi:signal transduction histidine kinase
MSETISCPNCSHPNPANSQVCERCGMNLAIAAILAETEVSQNIIPSQKVPLSPEQLVPRLGDYLIDKGLISQDDLNTALDYQKKQINNGKPILLGQVLITLGTIDQPTLDQAVTEQILQLQQALKEANQTLEQRVDERTAELQQALKHLTTLNTLKTNFVSNISHELRTPLAHMVGYLELLKGGDLGPLTNEQHKGINVMLKAYNRLYSLIDNLIQFSLVAEDKLSINSTQVPVVNLIKTTVNHAQAAAVEKQIRLKYQLPPKELIVQADEQRITWVLAQLVDNAIKFNYSGGEVAIGIRRDKGLAILSVQDTGIGIKQERIAEIFEPFHQLDGSATRQYGGTGIGLALVQQILAAHGSTLRVKSTPGEGSKFEFSLPMV